MNKINPKQLIKKNPIFESLFMPLYLKAVETQSNNPLIQDHKAVELIESLDYDFAYVEKNKVLQFHVAARTKILDEQIMKVVHETKNLVIINLGSGLDTRYSRIPSQHINCWYDIDLPEVIEFRNLFFKDNERYKSIGKSVLDFSWINDIDKDEADRVLFIAEGLFMYFNESEIKEIMTQIYDNFPSAQMLCEVFHQKMLKYPLKTKNNSSLGFAWGVTDIKELASMHSGVRIENIWSVYGSFKERQKLIMRVVGKFIPDFKDFARIVKIRFD